MYSDVYHNDMYDILYTNVALMLDNGGPTVIHHWVNVLVFSGNQMYRAIATETGREITRSCALIKAQLQLVKTITQMFRLVWCSL